MHDELISTYIPILAEMIHFAILEFKNTFSSPCYRPCSCTACKFPTYKTKWEETENFPITEYHAECNSILKAK